MNKKTNFFIGAALTLVGVTLTLVDRMSASADALSSYGQSFTVLTIIGLIFLMAAALWFYRMSLK